MTADIRDTSGVVLTYLVVWRRKGEKLDGAADADEFAVWIGNSTCRLNSLDSSTIYCSPPASQPFGLTAAGQLDPDTLPLVKVRHDCPK